MIIESIKFSIKRSIQYRANLISWFLADLSLYTATFLSYYFLTKKITDFGGYSSGEVLVYITSYFLINNIYATIFAEGISRFGQNVINGYFEYDLLKPRSLIKYIIIRNLNFPALISTPYLIALNIYCKSLCGVNLSVQYIASIICSSISMGLLFLIIYSFTLWGLRSEAISGIILQLLTVAEKPDTVFPKIIRNLLIYVIPIFLFSAIPTRIVLNRASILESTWCYLAPILYYLILRIILWKGLKKYQSGVE